MTENRIHLGNLGPGDVALLRNIAEEASQKAVDKTFMAMGLDPKDPITAQRDFGVLRYFAERMHDEQAQADRSWTRKTRLRMEGIVGKAILTAVAVSVIGAAHALWNGIKAAAR